jgi:alpha-L-fucosidase
MSIERPLPAWYGDAKFGIFVHWTAAAVPAFAPVGASPFDLAAEHGWEYAVAHNPYVEWYQNSLAIPGSPVAQHHAENYGDLPYDAFVEQFRAGHAGFRADVWADLFARAGARYVVFVTKHHDGFLLWPTATPNPHKAHWHADRDLVGELAIEVRARGMRFGTYYSGGLDWTFGGLPIVDFPSMVAAIPQTPEYLGYADDHWRELIDRYEPCVLWNDIGYPSAADLDLLFADYFSRVPDGVVNNRFDFVRQTSGDVHCDFVTPEYSTDAGGTKKWEVCRGIGTSFGYNRQERDADYLDAGDLVRLLVDVVARGGNLLLNVGPTGAGDVPWVQARRLLAVGEWLARNGEAIFDTRPWSGRDGPAHGDVRYTERAGALYAIYLGTPPTARLTLPGLGLPDGATVTILGRDAADHRPWRATRDGVEVDLPEVPATAAAYAVRATLPP